MAREILRLKDILNGILAEASLGEVRADAEGPEFAGCDMYYFAGAVVGEESVPTGVLVRLHESYGNISLTVDEISGCPKANLHFYRENNQDEPMEEVVGLIRGMVETACRRITRESFDRDVSIKSVGMLNLDTVNDLLPVRHGRTESRVPASAV